jgi:lysozyme
MAKRRTQARARRASAVTNAVVDLSHHNADPDFAVARDRGGIVGIVHKATQGVTYADPTYAERRAAAVAEKLLWGAYHSGTGSDGVQQAEHFLSVVQPDHATLLVLDFEANPQGPSMPLEEARAFVTHVMEATGRWPGLYSGHYIKELLGTRVDPVLAHCWLWLAQYGPTIVVPPNWATWTMWQYTDGGLGPEPHVVDGIGRCDRDRFNGSAAALRRLWTAKG